MTTTYLLAAVIGGFAPPGTAPAADSTALFMRPGVSRELAAHRAALIRDLRYDLRLDVTQPDTARGTVVVTFARRGGGDVILDFRGPVLRGARANGREVRGLEFNGAHVRVPAAALVAGRNTLAFDFSSAIAPAGASIIRFRDVTDESEYLYTLLVPADANALFPCFDQPDLKARVTLSLVTPREWTAVANGALVAVDSSNIITIIRSHSPSQTAGTLTHRFRETEPISTYLVAFAAGPWAKLDAPSAARPMSLYVRRSRAKEVEADSLFASNARALDWLERYFGRPYPFGKYDFVLAPAFPFGGMEHPGAVFYNEETFIFRERPTLPQRLGREATIFHEVAHQWFGDLVTMRWFDDLWLKEGFATYMAAKMQDALSPQANAWKTFYLRNKPAAYGVDVTAGTTPVWQALANLDQAKSNYGPIVYNKAPSVLKQLNYLVGDSAFKVGVRAFLGEHAYANATWRDLLRTIGAAAGRDLTEWGRQYILRPGMPVIEQRRWEGPMRCPDASCVELVQRPAQAEFGRTIWPVRTQVLFGFDSAPPVRVPIAMTGPRVTASTPGRRPTPAASWVFANAGDYAYALVLPDSASTAWLESHIGTVDDDLLRAMLWGSMWDLVRDARYAPAHWIAMAVRELPRERDEQIVPFILSRVVRATEAYLPDSQRDSTLPALERALAAGAEDTARAYGIRKAHLDALVAVARTPAMLARLDSLLDSASAPAMRAPGAPLRPPTRWAIVTTLIERAAPTADRRLAEEAQRDSTSEGKRRAFVAGAARPSAATKAEYFRRYFADTALNEDWATASLRAFNSPAQSELTLPYLVPALDSLPWIQRNRRIFFLGSWLGAFLDGQAGPEALSRVDRFLAEHRALPPDLRQKILQAADELRRTVKVRDAGSARAGSPPS